MKVASRPGRARPPMPRHWEGRGLGLFAALTEIPALENVLVASVRPVATITLNRPEQRNPLSVAMLGDLITAMKWCQDNDGVRVVVLTGAGDRSFSAGADLSSFDSSIPEPARHRGRHAFVELFLLMSELGKPIVGRINGGIWPMMIQAVLARNLPRKVLLEMAMLGERWTAIQMQSFGFVNRVVPRDQLDTAVGEISDKLAKKSAAVMRLGRNSFYRSQDMDFAPALDYLYDELLKVAMTEDAKEGVLAFFEKREPDFKGR